MNQDLLNFIKKLSQKDPKTLAQKSLKLSEECGELAKAVLSFTAAEGSKHKFADKQKILEEAVDVMLVALSVGYNLNFTTEQIMNMMEQKSNYWALLQNKEKQSPFPIPFELHVTIEPTLEKLDKFKQLCLDLEVKPIVLELINDQGQTVIDEVMTSSKFYGDNQEVQEELDRISERLEKEQFKILRRKIETAPWHPAVPSSGLGKMKDGNYFEAHIDVKIPMAAESKLKEIANKHKAILSHNVRKTTAVDKTYILTLRSYKGFLEEFKLSIANLFTELTEQDWEVEGSNIEYSFYDSKVNHDSAWSSDS